MLEEISFRVHLNVDYDTAIDQVTAALKEEGFGVLTEVNVKDTLKKKLDVKFRHYAILGACNPSLAHKALQNEPLVGLMLPCNVTVEETEDGALVNLINPHAMILSHPMLEGNPALREIAEDAYERLSRVAESLQAGN
jgi:uncharacterized protein (DUF302 family)